MRLLLTGAAGFTGQYFSQSASAAGHDVVALQANLTERERLALEVRDVAPELVVHLAAISFVGHTNISAFYDVNVVGTVNLLDALAGMPAPPKKVLLASSANIYGNSEQTPIAETQAPAPVNHYAMSKLAMEYMARNYLDKLPLFFTRPFNYTGLGQEGSFVIPKLVAHFARREPMIELGNLDVEREFNDVRAVCDAYLRLLDLASVGEAYNVCSGRPVTLRSVIRTLETLTKHSLDVRVNPHFVRANEIGRLCGDPAKLEASIGKVAHPPLEETLKLMLCS